MPSRTAALLALTLALAGCSWKDIGLPDFPLGVPEKHCSLMDPPDCRVPVPTKRIAP